jgi:dienelactone hydrolase
MRPTTAVALAVGALMLPAAARAAVKTKEIEYKQGDTTLQGFLAWDDAAKGKRPGVLIVHEWWGANQHARNQAVRLAKAGYVAFALDMYGKGKVATHPKDAQAFMEELMTTRDVAAARFQAGLQVLKDQPQVDPEKIAAFGYCMGGGIALAEARAGADLKAVAVFHAGLKPMGEPAEKGKVKAQILAQEGGKDPMVPAEQVEAFDEEMKNAGVPHEVIIYPDAKHSFTNPDAGKAGMDALKYDKSADEKSFDRAVKFLKKTFGT